MDYKNHRNFYKPKKIKCVFIAESPPANGTYFYCAIGRTTENLFNALMKAVCRKVPKTKQEGLRQFQKDGYILVDSIYKPINHLKPKSKRRSEIEGNLSELIDDLKSLKLKSDTAIILISKNVLKIVRPELIANGYKNIKNKNDKDLVPFPAWNNKNKKRFISKVREYIK